MDPIEDLILHSFSDEDSTDDMELEHSNEELFLTSSDSNVVGIDMTMKAPGSPSNHLPNDAEDSFPGPCPNMPWDDKPKVVERWLQMFQVFTNVQSFR